MEATHSTRVVIIDTKYVQTDAKSFKTVVQKLTGKDPVVAVAEENRHTRSARNSGLLRDSSFKEFQRVLREMPRIDELYSDWNKYIYLSFDDLCYIVLFVLYWHIILLLVFFFFVFFFCLFMYMWLINFHSCLWIST